MSHHQSTDATGSTEESMKSVRKRNASGWLKLADNEDLRFLIDSIIDLRPSHKFTPNELRRRAGISYESLHKNFPTLLKYGLIKPTDSGIIQKYQVNGTSPVIRELIELNGEVARIDAQSDPEYIVGDRLEELLEGVSEMGKHLTETPENAGSLPDVQISTNLATKVPDRITKQKSDS